MITSINIRATAGHVNLPIPLSAVIAGGAATFNIVGVPSAKDGVRIDSCTVTATNPAGVALAVSAVAQGGAWTATIPASHFAAAGSAKGGLMVECSGKDETDATRTWRLGMGDLVVIAADAATANLGELVLVKHRATQPATPTRGDLCKLDGTYKLYNGYSWESLGGGGGEQANWNETDQSSPAYIKNKPTAFTPTSHASTHAAGGSDPITPASIGAAAAATTYTKTEVDTALGGKVDTESGKSLILDTLVAWLSAFKGTDTATTLAALNTAIGGKVDKENGKGIVELTNSGGYNDIAAMSAYALDAGNASFVKDASILGNMVGFYEGRAALLNLDLVLGIFAYTDELPYSKSSTVGTRKVMVITATTAQSVTLPAIEDTDEILNCDIVVNGKAATADFGLTLVGGTGVDVHYPDGETITCKAGCVTMVSCVGINGLGWLVVGCNNLAVPTQTV